MVRSKKKNILLLGGLGTIGKILTRGLSSNKYNLIISDKYENRNKLKNYLKIDVTHYDELIKKIPKNIDVIINLIALPDKDEIVNNKTMNDMVNLYIKGVYNVFLAAMNLRVNKVIYASSNHVTDYNEKDGKSLLGRKIKTTDYPHSKSLYGCLKLCGESIGFAFHVNCNLSVICLRIGTVRSQEYPELLKNERYNRTILSKYDTIELFDKSISSDIEFGIYYGVSDNPNRPWSIKNAIDELGYMPMYNSLDILRKKTVEAD
jgi:NAD+ dependent glucose-6-phosphate dehydrogenase